jgi:hypothetical protein
MDVATNQGDFVQYNVGAYIEFIENRIDISLCGYICQYINLEQTNKQWIRRVDEKVH